MIRPLFFPILMTLLPAGVVHADWTRAAWANPKEALSLAIVDSTLICNTWGGDYRTSDGGTSWDSLDVGFKPYITAAMTVMGNVIYAGSTPGFKRSSDRGAHWETVKVPVKKNVDVLGAVGARLYAGMGDSGLYRSPDQGLTWSQIRFPGRSPWMMCFAGTGPTVFVGTQGGFFRSMDDGVTWDTLAIQQEKYLYVQSLLQTQSAVFAGISSVFSEKSFQLGLFKSTDNGGTWIPAGSGLPDNLIYSLAIDGDVLYCGTRAGVYRSINQGKSWVSVVGTLTDVINALAVHRGKLFACTKTGLWIRPLAEMSAGILPRSAVSQGFGADWRVGGLRHPGEIIRFSLRARARSLLTLHDAKGNLLATLQDATLPAGGNRVALPATGLPDGEYFLRLEAGGFSESVAFVYAGR